MSLRHLALYLVVAGLSIYAWKDWFKSLCGLILMMAIIQNQEMPTTLLGIQGLNPWNVLCVIVVLAWVYSRRREGLAWDVPRHIAVLLLMYLGVILCGVLRAALEPCNTEHYPLGSLISEELINTIKWVLPGLLLFDGCRTRKRVITVLVCLLAVYLLVAGQVIREMPLESVLGGGGEGIQHTRLKVCDRIGYSACDTSAMLAGASWGAMAALSLVGEKKYRITIIGAAGAIALGQAMTGGRAGYLAWMAAGLVLGLARWKKYLLLAPLVVILFPIVFSGTTARMLQGFGETDASGQSIVDTYSMTSGRLLIWPYVVDKIGESPWIGYGRRAMLRTGLRDYLGDTFNDPFPHPHNMYLETLLDNGLLGSIPIWLFWGTMLTYSARLFRSGNHLYSAVGGLTLSLMLTQLVAGIGAQHFYPRESTLGMWAAMFLALRVYVEETRARMSLITEQCSVNLQPIQVAVASIDGTGCGL